MLHGPPSGAAAARRCPQERLMAGGVAGAVSRTVVAPLERCRSIMMAVSGAQGCAGSPWLCIA